MRIIDNKNENWKCSLSETENLLLSTNTVNIKKSEYDHRNLNVYDELFENLNQEYQGPHSLGDPVSDRFPKVITSYWKYWKYGPGSHHDKRAKYHG